MYLATSKIPNAGKGLFADRDYKKGEIIGEYYGKFIKDTDRVPKGKELYLFTLDNGKIIVPDNDCMMQYINDAISLDETIQEVLTWFVSNKRKRIPKWQIYDIVEMVCEELPPITSKNLKYNVDWKEKGDRLYVRTIRNIKKGQEFYIYYGVYYWTDIVYDMVRKYL